MLLFVFVSVFKSKFLGYKTANYYSHKQYLQMETKLWYTFVYAPLTRIQMIKKNKQKNILRYTYKEYSTNASIN